MKVLLQPSSAYGSVKAIPSKSMAHRFLICSTLADKPTNIICEQTSDDIDATVRCLSALGAKIDRHGQGFFVTPIDFAAIPNTPTLDCTESASTLRFLLPVVAALGIESSFKLGTRLSERPIKPLVDELSAHGVSVQGKETLRLRGKLSENEFKICGSISSQFISGLLFALALRKCDCKLTITDELQSAPYVKLTQHALALFGVTAIQENNCFYVNTNSVLHSPSNIVVEGDWSNAAFILALGALSGKTEIFGLTPDSLQGDSQIVDILCRFGAEISYDPEQNSYTATRSELHGTQIDASDIPDLVPIIATVAAVSKGRTHIYGAKRLKLKESDRLKSTADMLNSLGADVSVTNDGLIIDGRDFLIGGTVNSANDHRIAMSAAVASVVAREPVTLLGAEAVTKSYPLFWEDIKTFGINFIQE